MAVLPLVALMALMMALIGQKTVYAGEELSYGCFGDVHIVPILKDVSGLTGNTIWTK